LRRLVREKKRRSIGEVCQYARQLGDILAFLHQQDPPIVHRDLTPDNIILREDGTIAVIDFGAANNFIGTATHTLIGKQSYMPPEQLRGKTEQRSDIYAFGATLYFLLTGDDPEPISVLHPRGENSAVPEELDALVAWCTQLEVADRPSTIADVAKKLAEAPAYA
jgi:serine/threonine-protein kinase